MPLPGVTVARGFEAVSHALRAMLDAHNAGSLQLNEAGILHARDHFDPQRAEVEIDRRLRTLLKGHRSSRAAP